METKIKSQSPTPTWIKDILSLLSVKSQYILTGNIRDKYFLKQREVFRPLEIRDALAQILLDNGFQALLAYDPIDGLRAFPSPSANSRTKEIIDSLGVSEGKLGFDDLARVVRTVASGDVAGSRIRLGLVIDYASRIVENANNLSEEQHSFFLAMEKLARTSRTLGTGAGSPVTFNPIFWLANRVGDLPDWFSVNNEAIHTQIIPLPDYELRFYGAQRFLLDIFADFKTLPDSGQAAVSTLFAAQTDGMTLRSMDSIALLAMENRLGLQDLADAIRIFRVGVLENPWKKDHVRKRIREANRFLSTRVKGQGNAIVKTLDILKRSVMGLSGAHTSGAVGRPRGVLFFAGPTGVGKTELVKALTQTLFDDERAYIRFDMSEFSAEHADQRLTGAPPGYIGYEAGGELTNAIRQRPFSVVLFDEIEKAHPRILDKFLQILEDGRLTDARGETVYFSEAVIVFTSNLGIYVENEQTRKRELNVSPNTPYDDVQRRVREAIEHHFKFVLARPEILNRIGDNIVIFDFIRPDVATGIFEMMLSNIQRRFQEQHDLTLEISPQVEDFLMQRCTTSLENGGRGIGNVLENVFINPLSRALFECDLEGKDHVEAQSLTEVNGIYEVILR